MSSWSRNGQASRKTPRTYKDRYFQPLWTFPVIGSAQPYHLVIRGVFDRRECEDLKALVQKRWVLEDQDLPRNKQFAYVSPGQCRWLYERMQGVFLENNIWRFSLSGILRPATVLRYEAGYYIRPHCDWLPNDPTYGKLSAIIMMSRPGVDFTGGGFLIEESKRPIRVSQGDVILFPSPMMHQVRPLRSGERIVCAMWAGGPPIT